MALSYLYAIYTRFGLPIFCTNTPKEYNAWLINKMVSHYDCAPMGYACHINAVQTSSRHLFSSIIVSDITDSLEPLIRKDVVYTMLCTNHPYMYMI